jgi:hypothetical protein
LATETRRQSQNNDGVASKFLFLWQKNGATTLGIMTLSLTTNSKKGLFETLIIKDTQHNVIQHYDIQHKGLIYDTQHK